MLTSYQIWGAPKAGCVYEKTGAKSVWRGLGARRDLGQVTVLGDVTPAVPHTRPEIHPAREKTNRSGQWKNNCTFKLFGPQI